ncbi:MAG TPA: TonB-dependent receptor, partial [Thermoanaerobaculia bacterium]|nr:TonB-dependent receptor [Thermoanaerobaculia bacterium]
ATGEPLRHRPEWLGSVRARWSPGGPSGPFALWADLAADSGSRDEQIPVPERDSVAGSERLGLAGSYRFAERWEARVRLDNLTDESYETLIGYPGPGRAARLSLRWAGGGR